MTTSTSRQLVLSRRIGRDQVLGDKTLDDNDIEPASVKAAVFLVNAYLTKTTGAAQGAAGGVEIKNAGDQLPVAEGLGRLDQRRQQLSADTTPTCCVIQVDREFGDAAVTGPWSIATHSPNRGRCSRYRRRRAMGIAPGRQCVEPGPRHGAARFRKSRIAPRCLGCRWR